MSNEEKPIPPLKVEVTNKDTDYNYTEDFNYLNPDDTEEEVFEDAT